MTEEKTLLSVIEALSENITTVAANMDKINSNLSSLSGALERNLSALNALKNKLGDIGEAGNTINKTITTFQELVKLGSQIADLTATLKKTFDVQVLKRPGSS